MVTIPIKLYSAIEDHDVPLHQVHAVDGGRIRYRRVCEVCGKVIEMREIAKAYDAPDDGLVMLSDDDLASLPADRSKQISVEQFAPADQIDTLLFDRAYYLEPAKSAAKAYALLRTTLERTDRVAIVQFALRQRTQLGALRVHDDVLAVQTLRWPDEVRPFELPDIVDEQTVSKRELEMAETLVSSYSADFDPKQFTDEYRDELTTLIDAKLEGGEGVVPADDASEGQDAEVLDLLAALERSVDRRGGTRSGRPSGRKTSGRSGSATKKPKVGKKPAGGGDAGKRKTPARKGA